MKWPTHTDYQDAIQNPPVCFAEPDLKAGDITMDMLGLPRVMSGNFASVYELRTPLGHWAVRCFVRQVPGQQGRYARLSQYLNSLALDCMVKFEYILKGILVAGEWYPIVQMQWVTGLQLNAYVEEHLQEPSTLLRLASKWRIMMNELRSHRLAHADLQHGNVMVTPDGELRLVDYDGMYCPAFGRGRSPELGHANFQHPRRTPEYYEERLDNFAALTIYLSILAVAREPGLWSKFCVGDNLLFTAADFKNTQNSAVFRYLKQSADPALRGLAELLQQCCIAPIDCTPWFEDSLVAFEKGTLGELTAAVAAQTTGAAPAARAGEGVAGSRPAPPAEDEGAGAPVGSRPAPSVSRASPPSLSRPSPGPALSRPAPEAAPAPTTVAAPPRASKTKLWLALAAVGVVVLGVALALLPGGNKAAPPVAAPGGNAPVASPPGGQQAAPPPVQQAPTVKGPAGTVASAFKIVEIRTLPVQAGSLHCLQFSPNARFVATGSDDGSLKVFDPAGGQIKLNIAGQGDAAVSVAFLPDGKTLASVAADNTLRYWNLANGQPVRSVADHAKNLWPICLAPDGQTLAVGATDRKIVRLLDPQTGAQKRLLSQHASWVRSVDFSPDSKLLAVACWDDTVKVWPLAGEARQTLKVPSNTVDNVVFSAAGEWLAAGGLGRAVKIWDTQTGALRQTLVGAAGDIKCYAFSPDARLLAAGSADKTVRVWETATGQLRATLTGHADAVGAVAFSPDGSMLASGSGDQTVKVWDVGKLGP